MMDDHEVLQGGVANAGAVVRSGAHVLRPAHAHSASVHALLRHLRDRGFEGAPEVVGFDGEDRERLVFVPGDVPLPPFPPWWQHDAVLASMAALLRRFHDAAREFEPAPDATWSDELRDPTPGVDAVLCHNDVCPENVVFDDGAAIALIDFDFAAPGRREWDLGAMAMMCAPLDPPEIAARLGMEMLDPVQRVRVEADGYGLDASGRERAARRARREDVDDRRLRSRPSAGWRAGVRTDVERDGW